MYIVCKMTVFILHVSSQNFHGKTYFFFYCFFFFAVLLIVLSTVYMHITESLHACSKGE